MTHMARRILNATCLVFKIRNSPERLDRGEGPGAHLGRLLGGARKYYPDSGACEAADRWGPRGDFAEGAGLTLSSSGLDGSLCGAAQYTSPRPAKRPNHCHLLTVLRWATQSLSPIGVTDGDG